MTNINDIITVRHAAFRRVGQEYHPEVGTNVWRVAKGMPFDPLAASGKEIRSMHTGMSIGELHHAADDYDFYIYDEIETAEFLGRIRDAVVEHEGTIYRPARLDEKPTLMITADMKYYKLPASGERHVYARFYVEDEAEAEDDPEATQPDPDLELVVQEVAGTTYAGESDEIVRQQVLEQIRHIRRVRRIVKEVS